jgi:hypothetical protein
LRLERLGEYSVAPGGCCLRLIDRLERAGQQQHRDVLQAGRLLDVTRHFIPAFAGHADIDQHNVGWVRLDPLNRLIAVAHSDDGDVLVCECQLDHALNGYAVVGEKKSLRHLGLIGQTGTLEQVLGSSKGF